MNSKSVGKCRWWLGLWLALGLTQPAWAIQIGLTSGANFYVDFTVSPTLQGDHISLMISNTDGVTYSNLWATLTGFTNTSMALGGGDPGRYPLGKLANTQGSPAFFYLQANTDPGNGSYTNQFTVSIYDGFPGLGTLKASSNFVVVVQNTIQANANTVTAVTSSTNPVVGGVSKVAVFGSTGTVGGPGSTFTGAAFTNWNAGAFQLIGSSIAFSNGTALDFVLTNVLSMTNQPKGDSYEADYYVRAVSTTFSNTPVSPVGYIQSGQQVKHTSVTGSALPPILPATNVTTLNWLVSSAQLYTNEILTFTLRVTNASSLFPVSLDRFVDTLPAGFVYVANSSSFGGAQILDPVNSSQVLTWSQGYTVPEAGSADLVFRAIPTIPGYSTNSCAAYIQNFQVGTSLSNPVAATQVVRALIEPRAVNVTTNVLENQTLSVAAPGVLANTVEPNGFPMTINGYGTAAHGTVTVNADGSYTYKPVLNYWGPDSFTFTLTNGNLRASTGTNNVTVTFVNQPPKLDPIGNLNLIENWSLQTVNLSGITAGPTNEPAQTLTVTASSSNPALTPNPLVNYTSPNPTGTLTFTPVTDNFGSATITVVVQDSGGTANGGVDSVTNTFTVIEQGLTNIWSPGGSFTVQVSDAKGPGGTGYTQTNYLGVLDVQATSTNPFTILLASFSGGSPGLAANFNRDTNYTWTIATTSRGVSGFATNDFVVDSSQFTNDLAGGYFLVALSPDGATVNVVFTNNHRPVASPASYGRAWGTSMRIAVADLLTNFTSDPDGDPRALDSLGSSTNGSAILTNTAFILVAPTNNQPESFPYVVRDVRAYRPGDTIRTATNWMTIVITNAVSSAQAISAPGGQGLVVIFSGVPGYAYDVERADNLGGPWTTMLTTNAPPAGLWEFDDPSPPQPTAFYRTRQQN
jgi:uncharacterized repeat protein (TIGR01451 family)